MEFVNHTPFPAYLFRTVIDEERLAASLLVRITYEIHDGFLTPSAAQPWTVSAEPWECQYGPMRGDAVFYKGGVDIFVFGHAVAPRGRAVSSMEVGIEVGSFHRRFAVFGNRVWRRSLGTLVASNPEPFSKMPLTMAHAYGGTETWDGLLVPHPDNPEGKGFYLEESRAVDRPLPNLESLEKLLHNWDDLCEPVGVVPRPLHCNVGARESISFNTDGTLKDFRPTLWNAAFPQMIAQRVELGEAVRLSGFTADSDLCFHLPKNPPHLRLRFDDSVYESPMTVDEVGIETDLSRVFIAYRFPFRYLLVPNQIRCCEILIKPVEERS